MVAQGAFNPLTFIPHAECEHLDYRAWDGSASIQTQNNYEDMGHYPFACVYPIVGLYEGDSTNLGSLGRYCGYKVKPSRRGLYDDGTRYQHIGSDVTGLLAWVGTPGWIRGVYSSNKFVANNLGMWNAIAGDSTGRPSYRGYEEDHEVDSGGTEGGAFHRLKGSIIDRDWWIHTGYAYTNYVRSWLLPVEAGRLTFSACAPCEYTSSNHIPGAENTSNWRFTQYGLIDEDGDPEYNLYAPSSYYTSLGWLIDKYCSIQTAAYGWAFKTYNDQSLIDQSSSFKYGLTTPYDVANKMVSWIFRETEEDLLILQPAWTGERIGHHSGQTEMLYVYNDDDSRAVFTEVSDVTVDYVPGSNGEAVKSRVGLEVITSGQSAVDNTPGHFTLRFVGSVGVWGRDLSVQSQSAYMMVRTTDCKVANGPSFVWIQGFNLDTPTAYDDHGDTQAYKSWEDVLVRISPEVLADKTITEVSFSVFLQFVLAGTTRASITSGDYSPSVQSVVLPTSFTHSFDVTIPLTREPAFDKHWAAWKSGQDHTLLKLGADSTAWATPRSTWGLFSGWSDDRSGVYFVNGEVDPDYLWNPLNETKSSNCVPAIAQNGMGFTLKNQISSLPELLGLIGNRVAFYDTSGTPIGVTGAQAYASGDVSANSPKICSVAYDGVTAYLGLDAPAQGAIDEGAPCTAKLLGTPRHIGFIDDLVDQGGMPLDNLARLGGQSYGHYAESDNISYYGSIRSELGSRDTGKHFITWRIGTSAQPGLTEDRMTTDGAIRGMFTADNLLWVFTESSLTGYAFSGQGPQEVLKLNDKFIKERGHAFVYEDTLYFANSDGFYRVSRSGPEELSYPCSTMWKSWWGLTTSGLSSFLVWGTDVINKRVFISVDYRKAPKKDGVDRRTSTAAYYWVFDTKSSSLSTKSTTLFENNGAVAFVYPNFGSLPSVARTVNDDTITNNPGPLAPRYLGEQELYAGWAVGGTEESEEWQYVYSTLEEVVEDNVYARPIGDAVYATREQLILGDKYTMKRLRSIGMRGEGGNLRLTGGGAVTNKQAFPNPLGYAKTPANPLAYFNLMNYSVTGDRVEYIEFEYENIGQPDTLEITDASGSIIGDPS